MIGFVSRHPFGVATDPGRRSRAWSDSARRPKSHEDGSLLKLHSIVWSSNVKIHLNNQLNCTHSSLILLLTTYQSYSDELSTFPSPVSTPSEARCRTVLWTGGSNYQEKMLVSLPGIEPITCCLRWRSDKDDLLGWQFVFIWSQNSNRPITPEQRSYNNDL